MEKPFYKLTGNFLNDGELLHAGKIIEFEGEPNEVMQPLNESAKEAKKKFLDKIASSEHRPITLVVS